MPIWGSRREDQRYVQPMEREFYTLSDLVAKTGLCSRTFRRRIQAGELRAYRFGKEYQVLVADYEAWRESHVVTVEHAPFDALKAQPSKPRAVDPRYSLKRLAASN